MTYQNTTIPRSPGIGLISVGWMGKLHSRAYKNLPIVYPELGLTPRLVHVADTSQERVDYAVESLGYQRGTTDYHELLADPEVDIVSICAPNFLHEEMAVAAAQAGKHFWIEKPAGRNAAETQRITDAAVAAGVQTNIGFNYRNAPAIEYARKLVADGTLGRITNVRGAFFADYSANPKGALSWRFIRSLAGSGVLGDLMGHMTDLAHYVVGPISTVTAQTSTVYTERPELPMGSGTHFAVVEDGKMLPVENEDYAQMMVQFTDDARGAGALGSFQASRVTVGPRAEYSLEVYGTEGSVRWNFERFNELQIALSAEGPHVGYTTVMANDSFGEFSKFQPGAGTSMGYDDLKVIEAMKFLTGDAAHASVLDALAAQRVVSAAETSADSNGTQQVVGQVQGSTAARPQPKIAAAPISWGVCEVPGWGYQMAPERVLDEMQQLGFSATEFGPEGFLPNEPEQKADLLAKHSMSAVGGFVPVVLHQGGPDDTDYPDPLDEVRRELESYQAAGAETLILAAATGVDGYDAERPVLDDSAWSLLLENLERIKNFAAQSGVQAVLHPHVGTMVESGSEVDRVISGSTIQLCFDTGHLLIGGTDPVEFAQKHAHRIAHAHMKDVDLSKAKKVLSGEVAYYDAVVDGLFRPLGQGDIDISAVIEALKAVSYEGWYVLEQDNVINEAPIEGAGPINDAAASRAFLLEALT